MQNLSTLPSAETANLLPQTRRPRLNCALLAANARAQAELGLVAEQSLDVRGMALRQLRTQKNLDPVMLATQACISLRQFYQLENGETTLFYSPGLRNQAGRRVATLLGVQWDRLGEESNRPAPPAINHLQLVSDPPAVVHFSPTSTAKPTAAPVAFGQPLPELPPVGLSKPASETLVVEAHATAQLATIISRDQVRHKKQRPSNPAWTLLGWAFAAVAGYGAGLALYKFWGISISIVL